MNPDLLSSQKNQQENIQISFKGKDNFIPNYHMIPLKEQLWMVTILSFLFLRSNMISLSLKYQTSNDTLQKILGL